MKKFKKVVSAALSLALVLSLAVGVSSAASRATGTQYDTEAGVVVLNDVTYPATVTLYLNGNYCYVASYCPVSVLRQYDTLIATFHTLAHGNNTKTQATISGNNYTEGEAYSARLYCDYSDVQSLNSWTSISKMGATTSSYVTLTMRN